MYRDPSDINTNHQRPKDFFLQRICLITEPEKNHKGSLPKEPVESVSMLIPKGGGGFASTSVSGAFHYIECVTPTGSHRRPPADIHTAKKVSQPSAMLREGLKKKKH